MSLGGKWWQLDPAQHVETERDGRADTHECIWEQNERSVEYLDGDDKRK